MIWGLEYSNWFKCKFVICNYLCVLRNCRRIKTVLRNLTLEPRILGDLDPSGSYRVTMSATVNASLSPTLSPPSPKVRRQTSSRRRAISQLPPVQTVEAHEAALKSIRAHLRSRTNYDSFPVSYRIIVLDTKLEVRKALQCLLYNGILS